MMHWIHYLLVAFEAWGIIYFYDSILDSKSQEKKWLSYLLVYAESPKKWAYAVAVILGVAVIII